MKRAVYTFWALTVIGFFVLVAVAFKDVPSKFFARVGVDGAEGDPRAFLMFFSMWAVPFVSVNLYPPLIRLMLRGKPDHKLRAPNRDFWLARPDGRERIITALQVAITGMMAIANLLMMMVYAMLWNYARERELFFNVAWLGAVGAVAVAFGLGYPFHALSRARAKSQAGEFVS